MHDFQTSVRSLVQIVVVATFDSEDNCLYSTNGMRKGFGKPYRDIDCSRARRGAAVASPAGKTKVSIRLDNTVLNHFRALVHRAGGGNYQTLINDALVAHIRQQSVLDAVRQVVREEMVSKRVSRRSTRRPKKAA